MRKKVHSVIYILGLMVIAIFMPLSMFVTNAAILMLSANWLIECDFRSKWQRLKDNKKVLIFSAIYLVHLLWLINTSNFAYASNDLIIKLPLLVLPIIIGTSAKLSEKKIHVILASFVLGVLVAIISGVIAKLIDTSLDYRCMSLFINRIRLSLMICLAIFILIYFVWKRIFFKPKTAWIAVVISLAMLLFISLVQAMTGFVCFVGVALVLLLMSVKKVKSKSYKRLLVATFTLALVGIISAVTYFIIDFYQPTCDNSKKEITAQGNIYDYEEIDNTLENGNLIWRNVCKKELAELWQQRSKIHIDSLDNKGQYLFPTLVRYLTSLGYTKDAEGVKKLSDTDITNIENGETNYRFAGRSGIFERIYVIIWEFDVYRKTGFCNNHSVTQRIEYQKFGLRLIGDNLLFGVGEGDVDDEYMDIYERSDDCTLSLKNRHRAHNQFMTFAIAFGLIGFVICIIGWFYPAVANLKRGDFLFLVFFLIATISMFSDDLIETSTGAVFVAYFYSLLGWGRETKEEELLKN